MHRFIGCVCTSVRVVYARVLVCGCDAYVLDIVVVSTLKSRATGATGATGVRGRQQSNASVPCLAFPSLPFPLFVFCRFLFVV